MVTSVQAAGAVRAIREARRTNPARQRGQVGPETEQRNGAPGSLQAQLATAQGELAARRRARLDQEIATLTARYSGDEALARRVAEGRMARNFAASDPDFATEIAPLQQRVTDLEEQIRRASQRRGGQTLAGGNGETLGGN